MSCIFTLLFFLFHYHVSFSLGGSSKSSPPLSLEIPKSYLFFERSLETSPNIFSYQSMNRTCELGDLHPSILQMISMNPNLDIILTRNSKAFPKNVSVNLESGTILEQITCDSETLLFLNGTLKMFSKEQKSNNEFFRIYQDHQAGLVFLKYSYENFSSSNSSLKKKRQKRKKNGKEESIQADASLNPSLSSLQSITLHNVPKLESKASLLNVFENKDRRNEKIHKMEIIKRISLEENEQNILKRFQSKEFEQEEFPHAFELLQRRHSNTFTTSNNQIHDFECSSGPPIESILKMSDFDFLLVKSKHLNTQTFFMKELGGIILTGNIPRDTIFRFLIFSLSFLSSFTESNVIIHTCRNQDSIHILFYSYSNQISDSHVIKGKSYRITLKEDSSMFIRLFNLSKVDLKNPPSHLSIINFEESPLKDYQTFFNSIEFDILLSIFYNFEEKNYKIHITKFESKKLMAFMTFSKNSKLKFENMIEYLEFDQNNEIDESLEHVISIGNSPIKEKLEDESIIFKFSVIGRKYLQHVSWFIMLNFLNTSVAIKIHRSLSNEVFMTFYDLRKSNSSLIPSSLSSCSSSLSLSLSLSLSSSLMTELPSKKIIENGKEKNNFNLENKEYSIFQINDSEKYSLIKGPLSFENAYKSIKRKILPSKTFDFLIIKNQESISKEISIKDYNGISLMIDASDLELQNHLKWMIESLSFKNNKSFNFIIRIYENQSRIYILRYEYENSKSPDSKDTEKRLEIRNSNNEISFDRKEILLHNLPIIDSKKIQSSKILNVNWIRVNSKSGSIDSFCLLKLLALNDLSNHQPLKDFKKYFKIYKMNMKNNSKNFTDPTFLKVLNDDSFSLKNFINQIRTESNPKNISPAFIIAPGSFSPKISVVLSKFLIIGNWNIDKYITSSISETLKASGAVFLRTFGEETIITLFDPSEKPRSKKINYIQSSTTTIRDQANKKLLFEETIKKLERKKLEQEEIERKRKAKLEIEKMKKERLENRKKLEQERIKKENDQIQKNLELEKERKEKEQLEKEKKKEEELFKEQKEREQKERERIKELYESSNLKQRLAQQEEENSRKNGKRNKNKNGNKGKFNLKSKKQVTQLSSSNPPSFSSLNSLGNQTGKRRRNRKSEPVTKPPVSDSFPYYSSSFGNQTRKHGNNKKLENIQPNSKSVPPSSTENDPIYNKPGNSDRPLNLGNKNSNSEYIFQKDPFLNLPSIIEQIEKERQKRIERENRIRAKHSEIYNSFLEGTIKAFDDLKIESNSNKRNFKYLERIITKPIKSSNPLIFENFKNSEQIDRKSFLYNFPVSEGFEYFIKEMNYFKKFTKSKTKKSMKAFLDNLDK